MITNLENNQIFKTSVLNENLKSKILLDIANKTDLSFDEPVSGMTASSILSDYLPSIELFKSETNLTGTPIALQAWFMTFRRGDLLFERHHTVDTDKTFSAAHFLAMKQGFNGIHFMINNEIKEINNQTENDLVIWDSDLSYGMRPSFEVNQKTDQMIILFLNFKLA